MLEVDDVHRPGPPAADSGLAADQLLEEALRARAEREHVTVPAVRRGHPIVRAQDARDPHADGLLAAAEMGRAIHLAAQEQRVHRLLEAPDQQHLPEQVDVQGRLVGPRHGRERVRHRAGSRVCQSVSS
jgi:hypothetical protein